MGGTGASAGSAPGAPERLRSPCSAVLASDDCWSSSQNADNANNAWNQNFDDGNQNTNNNKNNTNRVRAVRDPGAGRGEARAAGRPGPPASERLVSDSPAGIPLTEVFEAFESCRRHKRGTMNALAFELDYEANLVALWRDINSGAYRPARSIAFIVDKPVKREIFAADFRDRVVHHLIIDKLGPLFEREFIFDTYACRVGKGTHLGIRRVERFMRSCSRNHTRDCYILKLDIAGFFMSIDRGLLYRRLEAFVREGYGAPDRDLLLGLCRTVVFCDPARNCVVKGRRSDWDGLPAEKSLFHSRPGCGLPIGNLTSQVFANFYLSPFDHFMKHDLGLRYYGRYVDDIVVVHPDRSYLAALIPVAADYLRRELGLTLHPRKIHLEHCADGVEFLGVVIKPHRTCIASRTRGNFRRAVERHNRIADDHRPTRAERDAFRSSINSYLGLLAHYDTYRLRRRVLRDVLSPRWRRAVRVDASLRKVVFTAAPPSGYSNSSDSATG